MSETRKIAAILVSDVVGYSRLAGADEDRTLSRLRGLRSDLIDPAIAAHHGRVVKRTGDGALIEFRSAVDAVRCAVAVQNSMVERFSGVPSDRHIVFRIGIHLGDVVEESDGDLMGDGVNIAARLEGIAKPGTICLSEDAYRQVKGRLDRRGGRAPGCICCGRLATWDRCSSKTATGPKRKGFCDRSSTGSPRAAITVLRARVGSQRPILVYHEDLPVNDFNALFETLANDPQSYASNLPNVFPCAVGRSFYEQVLPPDHVHLGWCSYAAMWISRIPAQIPGHFFALASTGEARAAFLEQGARDWERFLSLRAAELKPGGRLIAVFPGANDDGTSALHDIMDRANATLADMVDEGTIKACEREKMALGVWPRRPRDLLEPFARDSVFRGLTVQHCETDTLADAAWADFERDGDKDALASKHALFFRTIFAPTLAGALERNDNVDRRLAFHTRLESGLRRRLADRPQPIHSRVETIVLTKSDEATTSRDSATKGDISALTGASLGRGASRGRSEL